MKLPIHLDIESDTIWTVYKKELEACQDVDSLKTFVERWKNIYPFKVDQIVINQDVMNVVKSGNPDDQDLIATNIILPQAIFRAMLSAKKYDVPLNTAFIQGQGGLGKFSE